MAWIWVLIPIFAIVAAVATTWIKVAHGYSPHPDGIERGARGAWHAPAGGNAADEVGALREALGKKDAEIANLEERVRVLERIVTDRSAKLRDEIDGL